MNTIRNNWKHWLFTPLMAFGVWRLHDEYDRYVDGYWQWKFWEPMRFRLGNVEHVIKWPFTL